MHDPTTYPLILHRFSEIASAINNPRFKALVEPSLHSHPWIPHHLIFFLQNYFEAISLIATNPSALRKVSTDEGTNKYNVRDFLQAEYCYKTYFDHLRSCTVSNSLSQFQFPPSTYFDFFPQAKRQTSTTPSDSSTRPKPPQTSGNYSTRQLQQLVVADGKQYEIPSAKLTCRPCKFFLEGKCSKTKEQCVFDHLLFPRDFNEADRIVMLTLVKDTPHLSWGQSTQQAIDRIRNKVWKFVCCCLSKNSFADITLRMTLILAHSNPGISMGV